MQRRKEGIKTVHMVCRGTRRTMRTVLFQASALKKLLKDTTVLTISLIPRDLAGEDVKGGYLQLFPNIHGTDGFFISKMERIQ
jgi:hypothetical protein